MPPAPNSVLGRLTTIQAALDAMESPTGDVAQANADAVWDEPLAGHTTPGSAGAALLACTIGQVGANQVTINVEDQDTNPVVGAQVDIFDSTNTIFLLRTFTDVSGQVVLALDDGTYNVRLFAQGVSFAVPEVMVVNTDPQSFTFSGTNVVNVVVPSAPNLCVIFGTLHDAGGNDLVGTCVRAFSDPLPQAIAGSQLANPIAETVTDQNGFFQLELIRTAPVRFSIEEAGVDARLVVPDQASQDLTSWT